MNRYHYAQGKFAEALADMAASAKPLTTRLAEAYLAYLYLLRDEDFPNDCREDFAFVKAKLTEVDAVFSGEGAVHASARHMHPRIAQKLIRRLGSIAYRLNIGD